MRLKTKNKVLLDVLEVLAAPYSIISRIMPQLAAIAMIVFITAEVFMYYQRLDPVSAIYASVGLVTTIGLYTPSISSMPSSEKVILTVLVASSVAVYATLITGLLTTITRRSVWVDARARWRASHLKDHIVVLSNMPEVADELDRLGVNYVIVSKSESLAKGPASRHVILGDPTSEPELKAAGIEDASTVVIALDDDMDNMTALLRAKRLNPKARIVVMIHHEDLYDVFKDAGASQVVRARRFLGRALAGLAMSSNLGGVLLESTEGSRRAVSSHGYGIGFFRVSAGSKCDGLELSALPHGIVPVLVERDGVMTPYFSRDYKLRPGDGLVVLGDPAKFSELRSLCGGEQQ